MVGTFIGLLEMILIGDLDFSCEKRRNAVSHLASNAGTHR